MIGSSVARKPLIARRWFQQVIASTFTAGILAAWELAGRAGITPLLPPVTTVFAEVWDIISSPRLTRDVLPSVARALAGFGVASVVGAVVGMILGYFRRLEPWTRATLEFLRSVPPPAILPLAVLVMGSTDTMRIAVIAVGAVWPVLLNAIDGTRQVDPLYFDVARTWKAGSWETIRRFVLPAALPQIMAGMRIALAIALIMMVISEMIAASSGLGYLVLQSQRLFAMRQMYAGVILIGALGWLFTVVFAQIERRVLAWYEGQKGLVDV